MIAVPFALPAIAWLHVVSLASGEYQFDALEPAFKAALAWVPAAGALAVTIAKLPRVSRMVLVLGLLFVLGAVVLTQKLEVNDAPTGAEFSEDFDQAATRTEAEVEEALRRAVGADGWEARTGGVSADPWSCRDRFGRSRGAVAGSGRWEVHQDRDELDLPKLQAELESAGYWVITRPVPGIVPDPYPDQGRDNYVMVEYSTYDRSWSVYVGVPCHRKD